MSKNLIDSYINHDKFVLENNVLREYNDMNEEIKKRTRGSLIWAGHGL